MSKPILSELEYNADDVASAILSKADLSITNEDLGVSDRSDELSFQNGWVLSDTTTTLKLFTFNGFGFLSVYAYKSSTPSSGEVFLTIDDSDLRPTSRWSANSISYLQDSVEVIILETDGDIKVANPYNASGGYQVNFNVVYRYA